MNSLLFIFSKLPERVSRGRGRFRRARAAGRAHLAAGRAQLAAGGAGARGAAHAPAGAAPPHAHSGLQRHHGSGRWGETLAMRSGQWLDSGYLNIYIFVLSTLIYL